MTPEEFLETIPYSDEIHVGVTNPIWSTENMFRFAKLYHEHEIGINKKLAQNGVPVNMCDGDIATIEALVNLLMENHGYVRDFYPIKKALSLTSKMYDAFGYNYK